MRKNYHRKLWGDIITGNYEEKLSQEIMRKNYHRKIWGDIITGNFEDKLSQDIMRRNYHRKLSAFIYHHAKNVGIIGIQKLSQSAKEGTVASPSLLEGNGLRTAHIMSGNH